jgi:hypothetical protein
LQPGGAPGGLAAALPGLPIMLRHTGSQVSEARLVDPLVAGAGVARRGSEALEKVALPPAAHHITRIGVEQRG